MSKDYMNDEKFWEEYTKEIIKMAYEEQCETCETEETNKNIILTEDLYMKKWCGIQKTKSGKYRVIVPMLSDFISNDMMINNAEVSGKILTRLFTDIEDAKTACMEFNKLHMKYN